MYDDNKLESALREMVRFPSVLDSVINTLNTDLYSGPVYLNKYGKDVCMFDTSEPGVHQFNFVRAARIVDDWLNANVPSQLYYEDWSGCFETSEPQGFEDEETGEWYEPEPYYLIDYQDIRKALLGRELANTI